MLPWPPSTRPWPQGWGLLLWQQECVSVRPPGLLRQYPKERVNTPSPRFRPGARWRF